jgi:hypothetical protein
MAVGATLKKALRQIATGLTKYASSQGWADSDYWIYYRTEPDWDRIHIIFVARQFDSKREFENYVSVRDFLSNELAADPEALDSLGLIVRSAEQVDQGGIYAIGPEYREFYTFYPSK